MTSQALDFTTIAHALLALSEENIGAEGWMGINDEQQKFLTWYAAHRDEIAQLDSLTAKASKDFRVLDEFLVEHGFKPRFNRPFDGVGVVSILDMLVEWLVECKTTTIQRHNDATNRLETFPAFKVPTDGAMIYEVQGFPRPLVELRTKSGHSLWLMEMPEPTDGLELAIWAHDMLEARRVYHSRWTAGVTVPMLEMSLEPNVDWIKGMEVVHDDWFIGDACQEFKLRANEEGARVKVATSLLVTRGISFAPEPYIMNQPFLGCFTQPGHDKLPLAAFWADTDSWRNPEGTLEEL